MPAPSFNGRIFDRIVHYDDRSLNFPIRALIPPTPVLRSMAWRTVQLNQGDQPACVGFSTTMMASSSPQPFFGPQVPIPTITAIAETIYKRAQILDDIPGENYEGSTVLGGAKAGVEIGWWTEYRWALGPGPEMAAADAIRAIVTLGPVIVGANWWSGMMKADKAGYLNPTGEMIGGHAFILSAYNSYRDAVRIPNSWGGQGQGWLNRKGLIKLLADNGEVCIPINRSTLRFRQS